MCGFKGNNNSVATFPWTSGSQGSPSTIPYYYSATGTSGALSAVYNPFFDPGCGSNTNILKFCGEPNPDFQPNDGWQFLHAHLGTSLKGVTHPSFTLYNKHTGILRVFTNLTTATQGQVALIKVENLGLKRTSLLSAYEKGASHALDQFGSVQLTSPAINNRNVQNAYRWVYADFKMVYDPCTCLFDTDLLFTVIIVNESSIDAQLNLIFNLTQEATLKAESKVSMGTGKDPIVSFLGKGSEGLGFLKTLLGEPANISNPNLAAFAKSVPDIAIGLSIVKFFWSTAVPASPSTTVTKFDGTIRGTIKGAANGTFTGTLSNEQYVENWTIRTPGSVNTPFLAGQATHYNEQLGVFHLLGAPVVQKRNIYHESTIYDSGGESPFPDYWRQTVVRPQFQCPEPIKYVLNPAADVCISELEASYFVEYMDGKTEASASFPLNCFKEFKFVPSKGSLIDVYPYYSQVSESHPIKNVYVKISGQIDANNGSGVSVTFAELYNVYMIASPYDLPVMNASEISSTLPSSCDNTFYESANEATINYICSSSAYKQASGQFLVKQQVAEARAAADKQKGNLSIAISPNPVQNDLIIRYNLPKEENKVSIQVLNINGQIVATILPNTVQIIGEQTVTYNTAELTNGVYMIRIVSDEANKITKMVVAH